MKKLGVIRLFICIAAIITELLPLGAVLKYGLMSDNGHLIFRFENYSYFDVTHNSSKFCNLHTFAA